MKVPLKVPLKAWNWSKYARRHTLPGSVPGSLQAHPSAEPTRLRFMHYGAERPLMEREDPSLDDLRAARAAGGVLWLDVVGLADVDSLGALGDLFDLHRLALEDVVNLGQRPKAEVYGEQLFVVLRMPRGALPLDTEQVSLFLGDGFVITFQERPGDAFEPVRKRIREGRPRLVEGAADYLAYALLDALVDGYFPLLEDYGEFLEDIEEEILVRPEHTVVPRLHHLKRDLLNLRRYVWPLRELLSSLYRDETPQITEATQLYLRDCHDHAIQVLDLVESYRDMSSGLMDLYLSSVSNRMNEVMKVLTIIATVFIPLGFIAGLYGMNFDTRSPWNMPELAWPFGYPFALGVMALVVLLMLIYFRRKGWLGGSSKDED